VTTFQAALDKHLHAIQARDIAALEETLADGDLVLITADGQLVRSRERFLQMHREWFSSKSWSLNVEPVSVHEATDLAVAVLKLDYVDEPSRKPPVKQASYLTLVFERRNDRWGMVQDQNTPCKAADVCSD
jgi:uncharacterized protein (TIGR02246 family)